jgi:hypothetical protein
MPNFRLSDLNINPVSYYGLPGATIPGVNVSGDGYMPDFRLNDLSVNPVGPPPQINVSSQWEPNNAGGSRSVFGGGNTFNDLAISGYGNYNLNSMNTFGNTLDPRITGGNYTFTPPFTLPPLTLPSSIGDIGDVYKDPEEFEETKARGGEVNMKDGSFVVDARTVSEMGNGSSNAGIERLAAMGGHPVRGDGDGVSDSVPARIGGKQKARVARDEVIFSPEAVARVGGGDHSKGTKKLYALMNKAHKARKKAGRGQDTKVAKGLGGLA